MSIDISGVHTEVTPALHDLIVKKLDKIQRKFAKITHIHVVLIVERHQHKAEATVNLSGTDLHAHADSDDMYHTIDLLVDKLDRQIVKYKEKIKKHDE